MDVSMDDKKDGSKLLELMKPTSKIETFKKTIPNFKNSKAKMSLKKIGRSRNQKGQKSY
jgi:hypothetical protein